MKKTGTRLLAILISILMMLACTACNGAASDSIPSGGAAATGGSEGSGDAETTVQPPLTMYTVTLDYNDGSGKKESIKVPEGGLISEYAPYPTVDNREVLYWSGIAGGAEYTAPVTADITLYGTWQTFTPVTYTDDVPATINDRYVEVRPVGATTALSGKILRIGPNVKTVSFVSDGTIYHDFAIMINERSTDINITFDNFAYTSLQSFGMEASASVREYCVNMTVKNTCVINCASAVAGSGQNGATCIKVPNLKLSGSGTLALFAGHGRGGADKPAAPGGQHGENGESATAGGDGISAASVEVKGITLNITAGNGGKGGKGGKGTNDFPTTNRNGGDGGRGGAGGAAILTSSFQGLNATLNLVGGNGGNGGNGGQAGGAVNFAGSGGDGGNGGKGGNVFGMELSAYEATACITTYTPGAGGQGGGGGDSEGTSVLDGNKGSNGQAGIVNAN